MQGWMREQGEWFGEGGSTLDVNTTKIMYQVVNLLSCSGL